MHVSFPASGDVSVTYSNKTSNSNLDCHVIEFDSAAGYGDEIGELLQEWLVPTNIRCTKRGSGLKWQVTTYSAPSALEALYKSDTFHSAAREHLDIRRFAVQSHHRPSVSSFEVQELKFACKLQNEIKAKFEVFGGLESKQCDPWPICKHLPSSSSRPQNIVLLCDGGAKWADANPHYRLDFCLHGTAYRMEIPVRHLKPTRSELFAIHENGGTSYQFVLPIRFAPLVYRFDGDTYYRCYLSSRYLMDAKGRRHVEDNVPPETDLFLLPKELEPLGRAAHILVTLAGNQAPLSSNPRRLHLIQSCALVPVFGIRVPCPRIKTVSFLKPRNPERLSRFLAELQRCKGYIVWGYVMSLLTNRILPERVLTFEPAYIKKLNDSRRRMQRASKFARLLLSVDQPADILIDALAQVKLRGLKSYIFDPARLLEKLLQYPRPDMSQQARQEAAGVKTTIELFRIQVGPMSCRLEGPDRETSNRVLRRFFEHRENFCRVTFVEEDTSGIHLNRRSAQRLPAWMNSLLRDGVCMGGKHFQFYSFSNSQLRSASAWFVNTRAPKIVMRELRSFLGEFDNISSVIKLAKRQGQCFSSTVDAFALRSGQIDNIPDFVCTHQRRDTDNALVQYKFNFTDGCGLISPEKMQEITYMLGLDVVPSAVQVRFQGCKGILALNHEYFKFRPRAFVAFRDSQDKFTSNTVDHLEICGYSRVLPFALNRQIITLLDTLGVPHQVFMRLQRDTLRCAETAFNSRARAYEFFTGVSDIVLPSQTSFVKKNFLPHGFHPLSEPFIRDLIVAMIVTIYRRLIFKTNVPVPLSALLFGVVDDMGLLQYDNGGFPEIFVALRTTMRTNGLPVVQPSVIATDDIVYDMGSLIIRDVEEGPEPCTAPKPDEFAILEGYCLVSRSPCYFPGDVLVCKAVNRTMSHNYRDVVVFPKCKAVLPEELNRSEPNLFTAEHADLPQLNTKIHPTCHFRFRDLPNMMSGGDLDGDTFCVIWDPKIVEPVLKVYLDAKKSESPVPFALRPSECFIEHSVVGRPSVDVVGRADAVERMRRAFIQYHTNYSLGRLSNRWLAFVHQPDVYATHKAAHPEALEAGAVLAKVVDGEPAGDFDIDVTKYPHFMINAKCDKFHSDSVLGKLFDESYGQFTRWRECTASARLARLVDSDDGLLELRTALEAALTPIRLTVAPCPNLSSVPDAKSDLEAHQLTQQLNDSKMHMGHQIATLTARFYVPKKLRQRQYGFSRLVLEANNVAIIREPVADEDFKSLDTFEEAFGLLAKASVTVNFLHQSHISMLKLALKSHEPPTWVLSVGEFGLATPAVVMGSYHQLDFFVSTVDPLNPIPARMMVANVTIIPPPGSQCPHGEVRSALIRDGIERGLQKALVTAAEQYDDTYCKWLYLHPRVELVELSGGDRGVVMFDLLWVELADNHEIFIDFGDLQGWKILLSEFRITLPPRKLQHRTTEEELPAQLALIVNDEFCRADVLPLSQSHVIFPISKSHWSRLTCKVPLTLVSEEVLNDISVVKVRVNIPTHEAFVGENGAWCFPWHSQRIRRLGLPDCCGVELTGRVGAEAVVVDRSLLAVGLETHLEYAVLTTHKYKVDMETAVRQFMLSEETEIITGNVLVGSSSTGNTNEERRLPDKLQQVWVSIVEKYTSQTFTEKTRTLTTADRLRQASAYYLTGALGLHIFDTSERKLCFMAEVEVKSFPWVFCGQELLHLKQQGTSMLQTIARKWRPGEDPFYSPTESDDPSDSDTESEGAPLQEVLALREALGWHDIPEMIDMYP